MSEAQDKSVISQGLQYDVWKYSENKYKSDEKVLYPNYPYVNRFDKRRKSPKFLGNTFSGKIKNFFIRLNSYFRRVKS